MRIGKDWIEAYFEYGIDVPNRRLFVGDIDETTIGHAVKGLYLMDSSSPKPIEIFISSFGGSVYDALALYDIVQTLKCPIHTFAYGKCMSAAPLLLACGNERWVSAHVAFMTHDWSADLEGKGAELQATVKHYEQLGITWNKLLTAHSKKTYAFWHKLGRKNADHFFTAEQAIEWGIADNIWSER